MRLFIFFFFMISTLHAQNNIVAHRGAWKNTGAPQNSLASLKHALEAGYGGSEFDINMSKDGKLVINHDADYFGKNIEDLSYKELNQTKLKNGEDLPLFADFLKMGKKYPNTLLFAEIKPSPSRVKRSEEIAEKVYKLVKKHKLLKQTIFISFSHEALLRLAQIDPNAHTQYLTGTLSMDQLKADKIHGADYHFSVFTKNPEWISQAKVQGLSSNVWTVNKPEMIEHFLSLNIDYITTDEPENALVLAQKEK